MNIKQLLDQFVKKPSAARNNNNIAIPGVATTEDELSSSSSIGYDLLKNAGWTGGGIGKSDGKMGGSANMINVNNQKGKSTFDNGRINNRNGLGKSGTVDTKSTDDEFELYRKRMMMAYEYRPNPLNNPRRKY